ncbi:MAG TPA: hypothetical protein VH704_05720 [Casimicrobiaceae bacterium]|jgi:hypothetical protein|nr:hypothetical protein [Casimicrobiaceae bacterium]
MPDSTTSPRISRRTLLKAGIAGGATLLLARWLYTSTTTQPMPAPSGALDARARAIVAAIAPVMLAGALPTNDQVLLQELVAGVEKAIAGLPPAMRKEVDQLFSLLSFAPSRALIAGVWSSWHEASPASIGVFLDRWRDSRLALLRSAYGALHQLLFAAWYGNSNAWPAIGYAGPPSLEAG